MDNNGLILDIYVIMRVVTLHRYRIRLLKFVSITNKLSILNSHVHLKALAIIKVEHKIPQITSVLKRPIAKQVIVLVIAHLEHIVLALVVGIIASTVLAQKDIFLDNLNPLREVFNGRNLWMKRIISGQPRNAHLRQNHEQAITQGKRKIFRS